MKKLYSYCKKIIKEHTSAFIISLLIGAIFLLPHILIPILQDETQSYSPLVVKGVDARTVDEMVYAAYVQEVTEGHLIPRSNILEWKDKPFLSHAGTPLPSLLVGMIALPFGIVNAYIFSLFFFTFLSSILIYTLAYVLTKNKIISMLAPPLLFFSPTYILKFFIHQITQPVSYFSRFYAVLVDFPILALGLLSIVYMLQKEDKKWVIASGILGGLLFYTYFYYWTFYVVFIASLGLLYLIRKDKINIKKIAISSVLTGAIAATFFLNSRSTVVDQELLYRLGATFGRDVSWSITILLIVLCAIVIYIKKRKANLAQQEGSSYFLLALLMAGIISMNVQVILGYTINARHWLTVVIWPTLVLVGIYVIDYLEPIIFKRKGWRILKITSFLIVSLLLLFGLIWQITFSQNTYKAYSLSDSQLELFDWLNRNTNKDGVVLSLRSDMVFLIPVYTRNNNFLPNAIIEPIPLSEIVARRLVAYKLLDISEEDIVFLNDPCAINKLLKFEHSKDGKYDYSLFEEAFSHRLVFESYYAKDRLGKYKTENGCEVPAKYKEEVFEIYGSIPKEWKSLVDKYHLDYIVVGSYEEEIAKRELNEYSQEVYRNDEFIVYKIS